MAYSKNRVDRAGKLLAKHMLAAMEDTSHFKPPRELQQAIEVVDWWRESHARPLSRVAANLRYYAAEHGEPVVAQRLKKLSTIADKLLREPHMKLSRMGDIGGVRAVLPDQGAVYAVAARLQRNWTITRSRDYIAKPKADGYRALHLINRRRDRLIEVQLRTPLQDAWANMVETDARLYAPALKFGGGPVELAAYYAALGGIFAMADAGRIELDASTLDMNADLRRQADTFKRRIK